MDYLSGRNSAVECQLPKLNVVGSIPIARSSLSIQTTLSDVSSAYDVTAIISGGKVDSYLEVS